MASLVEFDVKFLEKSFVWLNDPEIKALTLTPDFTEEQQKIFYKSLKKRHDYWIKGIMENETLIGAMGLKNINREEKSAEYWGYIGEKEYWGKGIGKFIIHEALKKAKKLSLNQLYLKVGSQNHRAKALYLKLGFTLSHAGEVEEFIITL